MPTTYEVPSAAVATPSATSLPLPPHVVCVSSVWPCAVPTAKATSISATTTDSVPRVSDLSTGVVDVTRFRFIVPPHYERRAYLRSPGLAIQLSRFLQPVECS